MVWNGNVINGINGKKNFLRYCEKCLVSNSDLVICDSKQIQKDMQKLFNVPSEKTIYIAYGADTKVSLLNNNDEKVILWFKEKKVIFNEYYLIVGRFVPENNYETMIMEFMKSKTLKDLVIITNVEENKFYNQLEKETHFSMDKRIKFVGTVYDKELLKKIRENAFAYIHGHSVGGTNPSLLEALALTNINLLFDVPYNREVANTAAIYFDKKIESLSNKINYLETSSEQIRRVYKKEAAKQIQNNYLWNDIVYQYENLVKIK